MDHSWSAESTIVKSHCCGNLVIMCICHGLSLSTFLPPLSNLPLSTLLAFVPPPLRFYLFSKFPMFFLVGFSFFHDPESRIACSKKGLARRPTERAGSGGVLANFSARQVNFTRAAWINARKGPKSQEALAKHIECLGAFASCTGSFVKDRGNISLLVLCLHPNHKCKSQEVLESSRCLEKKHEKTKPGRLEHVQNTKT